MKMRTEYKFISINEKPEIKEKAAEWFSDKWGIPAEEYLESIETALEEKKAVPRWYLAVEGDRIIGGAGVIENDFHERKDLTPNICAFFVEEGFRRRGIGRSVIGYALEDMNKRGVDFIYLITEHTSLYERYGFEFIARVRDNDGIMMRMYGRETAFHIR